MRPGTAAAVAGADDTYSKASLSVACGVGAAVVRREQFDVLVEFSPVDLVLDGVVGEVDLIIEVRQVVFARLFPNLLLVAVGPSVTVGAVAVVLLQELLVFALQVSEDSS